ncbi:MAG TPA: hydroxymethylglutaryl-CoA reductase, degradative [Nitrososphaera sp.]|nr:hydroxymethylglutaryl-CoA reductase, degradative [Nitrososphaera sp.]
MTDKKFYEMNRQERLEFLKMSTGAGDIESSLQPLPFESASRMVENAIGSMSVPMGVATNFVINGKEILIPMAIEEPSVIAAASKAAKIAKFMGGFTAVASDSLMIGQVQVVGITSPKAAADRVRRNKKKILAVANGKSRSVVAKDLQVRLLRDTSANKIGTMLLAEIVVDTKDAMGANVINTMCEAVAPLISDITGGGEVVLKILSNYATRRMVKCKAVFSQKEIGGPRIVRRILYAYALAHSDVYRAVTHNKGVMNGIDAVALATGQDFRAIEAGAHAFAARDGQYRSLTRWRRTRNGDLAGELELPLAVGVVGGITTSHPTVKAALQIMGVSGAKELAMVMACAGLAQNFAAIRALSDEGIQQGHMRLHARKFN